MTIRGVTVVPEWQPPTTLIGRAQHLAGLAKVYGSALIIKTQIEALARDALAGDDFDAQALALDLLKEVNA